GGARRGTACDGRRGPVRVPHDSPPAGGGHATRPHRGARPRAPRPRPRPRGGLGWGEPDVAPVILAPADLAPASLQPPRISPPPPLAGEGWGGGTGRRTSDRCTVPTPWCSPQGRGRRGRRSALVTAAPGGEACPRQGGRVTMRRPASRCCP